MCVRCSGAVLRLSNRINELAWKRGCTGLSNKVRFGGDANLRKLVLPDFTKHLQAADIV